MRYTILGLLSVTALSLVQLSAKNDIEPGKEFYTVVQAPKPIVLDGDLSEWSGVPVLADPKFAVPKYSGTNASPNYVLFETYAGGTWSGPDDQTSAVQIVYDADNVYFGFVVTDDYHENISGNAWNGDSVQLMIASADRTTRVALYNYALGGYEDKAGKFVPDANLADPTMVHHEAGPACATDGTCATSAVIKRDSANKKTIYEIKLPKAALGLETLKGVQFGLGMAINDGDGALVDGVQYGQAGQQGQKGWGGLGAHSIVFGKTPAETALVTIPKGNDIEPSKEYYTALRTTKSITLDGTLSEWTGAPVLADPKFAVPKYSGTNASPNYVLFEQYAGGTWSGPDDQTSAVQIVYDDNNVYFGFVVTDDYHENISGNAWNGDSVQLMIASADRTTRVALYNYALGGYEDKAGKFVPDANLADPTMVHHEAGPACAMDGTCATSAFIKRDLATKKTFYEIKLPKEALGLETLTAGTKFGLGMAINDGDGALVDGVQYGQAGQQGQKGWGGLGAHSIVFGKTPAETALVTLGTTVSGGDSLFLSSVKPSIASFSFRATDKGASIVDPANAKLTIDGKVVTLTSKKSGDATDFTYAAPTAFVRGTTVHTYTIAVKDTQGNTVSDQGTFKIPALKIGLNFGAEEPLEADPAGSALRTTDVAGAPGVAQDHWNNLRTDQATFTGTALPNTGLAPNPLPGVLYDTGEITSMTVTWDCANTWASTGKGEENNQFTGADKVLMTGYLDTGDATTSHVTIQDIPDMLTGDTGYDLYVYALGGVAGRGGGYRVLDSTGKVLQGYVQASSDTNPKTYKEAPARGPGTYIVFKGLKASTITLEATTASGQAFGGSSPRAPVNAVQLVPAAPAVPISATISRSGNNVIIQWAPTGGTLEFTPALGPTASWTAVGTANPSTVPIGTSSGFYRVRK